MEAPLERIPAAVSEAPPAWWRLKRPAVALLASPIMTPVATRTTRNNHHHNYFSACNIDCRANKRRNNQQPTSSSSSLPSSLSINHLKSSLQLLLFIFALIFVPHFGCTTATPVPSIPGSASKQQQELAKPETGGSGSSAGAGVPMGGQAANKLMIQQQLPSEGAQVGESLLSGESNAAANKQQATAMTGKTNTAEKLKRGLTNFMNQLNPAPFFVPPSQQQHAGDQAKGGQPNASSAEPATIVNSDSSLVMKGAANRWAFARPIGGPLRWGRR